MTTMRLWANSEVNCKYLLDLIIKSKFRNKREKMSKNRKVIR